MTHEVVWSNVISHVTFLGHSKLLTRLWQYVVVYLLSNLGTGTFILFLCKTAEETVRDELRWS